MYMSHIELEFLLESTRWQWEQEVKKAELLAALPRREKVTRSRDNHREWKEERRTLPLPYQPPF